MEISIAVEGTSLHIQEANDVLDYDVFFTGIIEQFVFESFAFKLSLLAFFQDVLFPICLTLFEGIDQHENS